LIHFFFNQSVTFKSQNSQATIFFPKINRGGGWWVLLMVDAINIYRKDGKRINIFSNNLLYRKDVIMLSP